MCSSGDRYTCKACLAEVLAVWWQCQRRALAVVVFELGLEIWVELGRVTSSSEHFQVELIAWIVMWIMRALCVLELYMGHSIRVWRTKSGVKGDASRMLTLGAFAIPCLVMSSEELWVEDHHEHRVLGSLGCCVMGMWWDWGPERTVCLVWIIWGCEHRQRQKSWWCSEVRMFRKIFRRMENWLVFGIVWMSREWESEQLEGLSGFWVVEGSEQRKQFWGEVHVWRHCVYYVVGHIIGALEASWRQLDIGSWSIMRAGERLETQVSECLPYGE